MFKTMHNVNIDKLKIADTLDVKHSSKLEHLKDAWTAATRNAANNAADPLTNPAFVQLCADEAFTTGEGWHAWVTPFTR